MRFAVIEYRSKSGKVWRHTKERPNYSADPDKEIDPTSFGCYVSALEGEHIPLMGLITGELSNISEPTRFSRRVFKKITGRWPQTFSLEYLRKFDVLMVVHQISDGHEVTAFTQRLKKQFPRQLIIGVPTQPFGILQKYWDTHPAWLKNFRTFLDACDLVTTLSQSTLATWQTLTKKPVIYLPQPYPVEYTAQFFTPLEQKNNTIFVAGVAERDTITRGYEVARRLQALFPNYLIYVTRTPGVKTDLSALGNARYEIVSFQPWREHLEWLKKIKLIINTDFTQTRGRVQVDAAAVGTPSIGADSDGQRDLYPEFQASPNTPVDELLKYAQTLLTDSSLYRAIVALAHNRLQQYSYTITRSRITDVVKHHKS